MCYKSCWTAYLVSVGLFNSSQSLVLLFMGATTRYLYGGFAWKGHANVSPDVELAPSCTGLWQPTGWMKTLMEAHYLQLLFFGDFLCVAVGSGGEGQLLSALLRSAWLFHHTALCHHGRSQEGYMSDSGHLYIFIDWHRWALKPAALLRRLTHCLCPVIHKHFCSSIQTFHNNLHWCFIHQMRLLMKKSIAVSC